MYLKLLLAGLLLLAPLPALADVSAHYSLGSKDKLVIEADDGGNFRTELGDKFTVIRRDGVDYIVMVDAAGGFEVARFDAVLALIAGELKQSGDGAGSPALTFEMRAGAEESVVGYSGMIWFFGPRPVPGKEAGKQVEIVMSADPALAPIGVVFRHLIELANPLLGNMLGAGGNFPAASAELFTKGTPLRVGPVLKLESVSTTEIAAARFELPGAVMDPVEFLKEATPSESGGGLAPLP